jgi:plastocyanin
MSENIPMVRGSRVAKGDRRGPKRLLVVFGVSVLLALAASACGSSASSTNSTTTTPAASASTTTAGASSTSAAKGATSIDVTIKNFAFSPDKFTVAPGAKIVVTNKDSVAHTLTDMANSKLFDTGNVNPGQTKTITAPTKPGTYPFFCAIHNYMTGTLTVS